MPEPITALTPAPTALVNAPTPFSTGPHLQPQFDVIEILPERAQERLRALRLRSSEAHAVTVRHAELQEATTERTQAENRLRQLLVHTDMSIKQIALQNERQCRPRHDKHGLFGGRADPLLPGHPSKHKCEHKME
jgi:hypothetical protein